LIQPSKGPLDDPAPPAQPALDLRDGRTLWCSQQIPDGDVSFVAIPDRHVILVWCASDQSVSLLSIDTLTGRIRWRHSLNVKGSDWQRLIAYLTGLPAPESARPLVQSAGRVAVVAGEARRFGPVVRPPDEVTMQLLDVDSGRLIWQTQVPLNGRSSWLSWTFSPDSLVVTTGKTVESLALETGATRWSTALDDVRSLHVPGGAAPNVVVVDFDARNWSQPTPTIRGRGVAVLDSSSGRLIWQDREGHALHPLDETGRVVFVEAGRGLRAIETVTGRRFAELNPEFPTRFVTRA